MLCLLKNKMRLITIFICFLISVIGYSQTKDSISDQKKDKSGYTSDLEKGIASLTAFLALEDDAESHTFLRFSKFDSITNPWFRWKRKVNDKIGLQFSTSYSTSNMYGQNAPDKMSDYAGSGIFKVYTRWNLVNRGKDNTGTLVINADHRHAYSSVPPSDLGFNLGYNGIPGLLFSDAKLILLELTWQQIFNKGRTGVIVGRYDPNDYLDVLGYVNPFTTFQNLSILVNASIALPDSSTGIGIGQAINDQFTLQATVNDVNGVATELKFFEDFSELYTSVELAWSPTKKDRYFKNFHITYWHADDREKAGIEESQGVAIGFNWTFHETFMPFVKIGWSGGSAPIYSQSYTGGFIIRPNLNKDLVGIAVNWGETQDGVGQLSNELFYRFQFSQNFAITPSLQFLINPGLNTQLDNVFIFGLRGRIAL